jgi:ribonuclease HII
LAIVDQLNLLVQVDGNQRPKISLPCEAIVKGDSKVQAISAASILAKTARDAALYDLDRQYPMYGFAQHKGYQTVAHMALLRQHGVSPVHRLSYAPVKALIQLSQ